jgi:hypothetical protein
MVSTERRLPFPSEKSNSYFLFDISTYTHFSGFFPFNKALITKILLTVDTASLLINSSKGIVTGIVHADKSTVIYPRGPGPRGVHESILNGGNRP